MTAVVTRSQGTREVEGNNVAPARKRRWEGHEVADQPPQKRARVTNEFLEKCKTDFNADPKNIISRNAIVSVGTILAATNSDAVNKVNHIFMNTIKEEHVKATNQQNTGRCWMFGGFNMFRHLVIKALDLKNFEFSETYLFFYDKVERANVFLNYIMQNLETPLEERTMEYMLRSPVMDGGYWNMFANLVEKYGVIPKESMKETFHSGWSEEINDVLNARLRAAAHHLRNKKLTPEQREQVRSDCVQQVYDILVKFLGTPPAEFEWSYIKKDYSERQTLAGLTPATFKMMTMGALNIKDFIELTHFPSREMNKVYEIKHSSNIVEGLGSSFLNLPIQELKKHAANAITSGIPVWVGVDVKRGFNPFEDTLDEKLIDYDLIFGKSYPMTKADRLFYRESSANHAMCLTGVDFDEKGKTTKWQVENSWGFFDDETPGEDGFLTMSDDWFDANVFEVVIHKNQLSRTTKRLLEQEPIKLEVWDPTSLAALSK